MTLEPTEEQALLRDMVSRFLADRVPPEAAGRESLPMADWRALGALGVLALAVPEAAGGLGGGPQEVAIVAETLGRAAAMTPMAECAVLCAVLIAESGDDAQRSAWIDALMSGEKIVAYVGQGEGLGELSVERSGDDWVLAGERLLVRHGAAADAFVVAFDDAPNLLLVEAGTPGVATVPYRLADGERAAVVRFEGVKVPSSARLSMSTEPRRRALALAQLAIVAEMVGLMQTLYEATVEHVRQRRQFGVAIGSFQVIQHRVARLFVLLEQSRSMLLRAVFAEDANFTTAVTQARAYVADAALRLAQDATQLHGGMGVTEDLLVGRGHRRLLVLSHLFGGASGARAELAA
ncbi:acyl-CoA dehydrogenase family protein [Caulobacter sp. LARHSG274]